MIDYAQRCLEGDACPLLRGELCVNNSCATKDDSVCLPSSVSSHERKLRVLGCVLTGSQIDLTLHHCRGGSMASTPFGSPGVGQKQNHALQIPLAARFHVWEEGIDARINGGVQSWELKYSTQVGLLNLSSHRLGYSQWMLAYHWASPLVRVRVERFCLESPYLFRRASMPTGLIESSSPRTSIDTLLSDTLRMRGRPTSNGSGR